MLGLKVVTTIAVLVAGRTEAWPEMDDPFSRGPAGIPDSFHMVTPASSGDPFAEWHDLGALMKRIDNCAPGEFEKIYRAPFERAEELFGRRRYREALKAYIDSLGGLSVIEISASLWIDIYENFLHCILELADPNDLDESIELGRERLRPSEYIEGPEAFLSQEGTFETGGTYGAGLHPIVRILRVYEEVLERRGHTVEALQRYYSERFLMRPAIGTETPPDSAPKPTVDAVMYADFVFRHRQYRDELLNDLTDTMLCGPLRGGGRAYKRHRLVAPTVEAVRTLNSYIPVFITTAELAEHVMKRARLQPGNSEKAEEILDEICRYRSEHGMPPVDTQHWRIMLECFVLVLLAAGGTGTGVILYRRIRKRKQSAAGRPGY